MLTPAGRWVLGWGLILLALALLLHYAELLLLGTGCVGSLLLAVLWMRQRPDVVATRTISPERVSVAEEARGELRLVNRSKRRSPPFAAVERFGGREIVVSVPSLAPGGETGVAYALPTTQRGVFPVGPLTIGHTDPLRLMRVARTFASSASIWVHPALLPVAAPPTGRSRDMDGPTLDSSPRGGIAFHSLREYVPGDDRRLIHWPSSARLGTLLVRNQVVPNEPRIHVVLDTSEAPYDDECFEDAVRVAGSLAVAALSQGFPVELRTTGGDVVRVSGREAQRGALLDLLAGVARRADDRGLLELARLTPDEDGVSLAVVTGQVAPEAAGMVGRVRSRYGMVSMVLLGERFGRPAPAVRGVLTVNAKSADDFRRVWSLMARTA